MKDCDPSKEPSYLMYLICQQLTRMGNVTEIACKCFKRKNDNLNFYENFMQNYDGNNNKEYTL